MPSAPIGLAPYGGAPGMRESAGLFRPIPDLLDLQVGAVLEHSGSRIPAAENIVPDLPVVAVSHGTSRLVCELPNNFGRSLQARGAACIH
jgi:hypothetical protein